MQNDIILNQKSVDELYSHRLALLESMKNNISLKFYHKIEEKLLQEKKQLEKLLNIQEAESDALSEYSFALNPYFFDQKFL